MEAPQRGARGAMSASSSMRIAGRNTEPTTVRLWGYRYRVGQLMVRHMCADGL
jgi:hypothetical protein